MRGLLTDQVISWKVEGGSKLDNYLFADSLPGFFVYFDVLLDDGFPIEQNGLVRATVMAVK